ncbi:hypothetical protein D5086_029451 [Populus alba]|uniref:Uncharacterized protein n=1 Tax=Populus alba TaxID=43335 RepID=A0ACC4ATQ4_POPAL
MVVTKNVISPSTVDHVLVKDCSDCDAFEEDEVDYSVSEYASGGSSKFFRSLTPIPAIGKLDLPSGSELMVPPPPLGDSGKSTSNPAPATQHASSPIVEDTYLDPMHVGTDEWEIMRGKHTKKLLSPGGNNVHVVELHAGISARVSIRSGGRKHANKGQGSGRGPPATTAK